MAEAVVLAPVDPFAALVGGLPAGEGDVRVSARPGCTILAVMARAGDRAALRQRFEAACGLALPDGPGAVFGPGVTAIGTGPGTWLLVREAAPAHWPDAVADALDAVASVADQSGGYALLELAGEGARRLLGRSLFIDLHPESFAPGSAAVTLMAHIGLILWQVDEAPRYGIAVFRSFCGSFWHGVEAAAQGAGLRLARAS